jgi:mono/diheme cytochrome c family protein
MTTSHTSQSPAALFSTLALALAALLMSAAARAETPLERGRYLMTSIVACGNCHTPRGPQGPLADKELAGGLLFDEKGFKVYSANITPDKRTGIGNWTDVQIVTAIREGKRPDGSTIGPPMPFEMYRDLSDNDVKAIVAYLRSVKPVQSTVPKAEYSFPLPPNYGPPVGKVADVPRSDTVAYGRYLAGPAGHCVVCHTLQDDRGQFLFATKLGAGGNPFPGPWGISVSPNITPTGLKQYTDAQIKTVITTGVRPDGSHLKPPMGVPYYAHLSVADQAALVAYLRSLPPK